MERYVILTLSLLAVVIPSVVLAAPTLLDQLMDVNTPDHDDPALAAAIESLEKRDIHGYPNDDDGFVLAQQFREKRASTTMNRCMKNCWLCIQALRKDAIKLGACISGCSGVRTRKMLTNPLDANSWTTCRNNFIQS